MRGSELRGNEPRGGGLQAQLDSFLAGQEDRLIAFRRDVHMHPELGYAEHRTTARIAEELTAAGLRPMPLPKGTGLICEVGCGDGPVVALRADIDALPLPDEKDVPYRSTVPGVAHACGHDVHTTIMLGVARFFAQQAAAEQLPGRVRLIFQPAEENPGGALDVMAAGGIAGIDRIFALHCDPRVEVGQLGLRAGPITAACDKVNVRVTGPGGHTARPHLTADLVYALAKIVTELPAALSRRVDPRSSLSLVWGRISAGSVANAIPDDGIAQGTVRCLDDEAWHSAPDLMKALLDSVASAYDVKAELDYVRGVPPTVNEKTSVDMFRAAVDERAGRGGRGRHAAEPRRRGFRLVPGVDSGRLRPARRRRTRHGRRVRPPPWHLRRRRALHLHRGPRDGRHRAHRAVGEPPRGCHRAGRRARLTLYHVTIMCPDL